MSPEELTLVLSRLADLEKRMSAEELKMSRHKHLGQIEGTQALGVVASATVYAGRVTSSAAGTPFPSGWSVSHPSTGNWQVTHNLGTTAYAVVIFAHSIGYTQLFTLGTNTFNVNAKSTVPADTDIDFDFILVKP